MPTANNVSRSVKTVEGLRERFQPKLSQWKLQGDPLRLLAKVQDNWLRGEGGLDTTHFRQENNKNLDELNHLLSYQYITVAGAYFQPKWLGFCMLLVSGNGRALKLRSVMERVHKAVKRFLEERPLVLTREWPVLENDISSEDRGLLLRSVTLMQEGSVGVNYNPGAQQQFSFSDAIYGYGNVVAAVWHHLEGHSSSPSGFVGLTPVTLPFDLTRLELSKDAHANAVKAVQRLNSHPESAVTSARAALEATFKHILGAKSEAAGHPFPKQVAACRDALKLEKDFVDLGRSLVSAATAVSEIRNKFGDSHGKASHERPPTRAEASLAVGAALLLSNFLLERWEVVQSAPER
jgi:hypothetical protein